jgi:hypothetical protein
MRFVTPWLARGREIASRAVLHDEPLTRGHGKAHVLEKRSGAAARPCSEHAARAMRHAAFIDRRETGRPRAPAGACIPGSSNREDTTL